MSGNDGCCTLPAGASWGWLDTEGTFVDRIRRGAARFRHKFGQPPRWCYVSPRWKEAEGFRNKVDGIQIRCGPSILHHVFYFSLEPCLRTPKQGIQGEDGRQRENDVIGHDRNP